MIYQNHESFLYEDIFMKTAVSGAGDFCRMSFKNLFFESFENIQ